jgi:hypothetical protein
MIDHNNQRRRALIAEMQGAIELTDAVDDREAKLTAIVGVILGVGFALLINYLF